jgi:single-strand DNA-binding protein
LSHETTEVREVNVVSLVGNLATDVELREVAGGKKVASFLLAIDRPGGEEADFVAISAWERQAETCAEYLAKGRLVAVDGRLRSRSWEAAGGEKRSAVEVVANRVEFLSPPAAAGEVVPFARASAAS